MSIRIGVSCVTPRDGNPTAECLAAEIRQVEEDGMVAFLNDFAFCMANGIYVIANIDLWGSSGHHDYTELQWRQRVDGLVYTLLQQDPTATKWRVTIENEPGKYHTNEKYAWLVNIAYDQIRVARGWTKVQIGAGNEEFSKAAETGLYEYILANCKFDYLDIHIQAAVIDPASMRVNQAALNMYGAQAKSWAATYKKKLSCTEANWCDVSKATGYEDLIKIVNKADEIGCEDCCIVFTDFRGDDCWLSFLNKGVPRSQYWESFKAEIIKRKPQEGPVGDRIIKLITPAMEGTDVKEVEDKLKEIGFDINVNSRYENDDYQATRKFQELTKIVIDGKIGPQTKGMLDQTTLQNFYPEVFQNIYQSKQYTAAMIDYWLAENAISSLTGHGKYFVQAESETGIPAEWQLANGLQESGERNSAGKFLFGQSYYGRNWKNLYGWGITDSGPIPGISQFDRYQDCILIVAHKIKDLFLDPNNWRYAGDHIFGIEWKYSTASFNAINKAKYYREICNILDGGIKTKIPEYIEDLVPLLEKYFVRKP